jgi:hypothetical protein
MIVGYLYVLPASDGRLDHCWIRLTCQQTAGIHIASQLLPEADMSGALRDVRY